jgi:hypothetical protein
MDIFRQTKIQKYQETPEYYNHLQILLKALESVNHLKKQNINLGEFWALSQASSGLEIYLKDKSQI